MIFLHFCYSLYEFQFSINLHMGQLQWTLCLTNCECSQLPIQHPIIYNWDVIVFFILLSKFSGPCFTNPLGHLFPPTFSACHKELAALSLILIFLIIKQITVSRDGKKCLCQLMGCLFSPLLDQEIALCPILPVSVFS